MQWACSDFAYLMYQRRANCSENLPYICSSIPSLPLIRFYCQTPGIFFVLAVKHSPLSSIILSHPAKAVAGDGQECKKKKKKKSNFSPQKHLLVTSFLCGKKEYQLFILIPKSCYCISAWHFSGIEKSIHPSEHTAQCVCGNCCRIADGDFDLTWKSGITSDCSVQMCWWRFTHLGMLSAWSSSNSVQPGQLSLDN